MVFREQVCLKIALVQGRWRFRESEWTAGSGMEPIRLTESGWLTGQSQCFTWVGMYLTVLAIGELYVSA